MNVAENILAQLGGNRFVVMTGAKNLLSDKNALQFQLPSRFAKDGINAVRVTLDPSDTYTVTFQAVNHKACKSRVVHEVSDVYADSLRNVFTMYTGLETSLGTMSAGR